MHKTIDTPNARRIMQAGGLRGATVIGQSGGWAVLLKIGTQDTPLGTQRTDKPRMWSSLDSCVQYLRQELGIVRIDSIDASNYSPESLQRPRRPDAAAQMRRAHQAAAHDAWFREQVGIALTEADDPATQWISHEQVQADWAQQRAELVQRSRA